MLPRELASPRRITAMSVQDSSAAATSRPSGDSTSRHESPLSPEIKTGSTVDGAFTAEVAPHSVRKRVLLQLLLLLMICAALQRPLLP
jgi:ABC-type Na+ efflux pump permease subunit